MKVTHICVISDDYPTKDRMVFVFVQQLVEAFFDAGIKISVIAPQSLIRSLFRGVKIMPRQQVYYTGQGESYFVYRPYSLSFSNGNVLLNKLASLYNKKTITKSLKAISPDVVYGHFWHSAMKGSKYAMSNGKPLFVACGEGDDSLDNWASSLSSHKKKMIRESVTGVICVSSENKRKCLEYELCTEDNTIVLPNCVNEKIFHPVNSDVFRKELGGTESDFIIAYTGAFINRKGYNRLSEAINRLQNDKIKVIFSGKPMLGHDADLPNCNGIIHCGPVNHDDLPKFLCASDVFVLPTLKEGCCNSIVEALACGIPVISSDQPFNDDILNTKNSLRIDSNNVSEIANAIELLFNNKTLYKQLKDYSRANSSNYSIVKRARRIIEFIDARS